RCLGLRRRLDQRRRDVRALPAQRGRGQRGALLAAALAPPALRGAARTRRRLRRRGRSHSFRTDLPMSEHPLPARNTAGARPAHARLGLAAIFGATFFELVGYFMLTPLLLLRLKDSGESTALA